MENKDIVNEVLDYLKYKVNSDSCTPEEIRNISNILTKELGTLGTVRGLTRL